MRPVRSTTARGLVALCLLGALALGGAGPALAGTAATGGAGIEVAPEGLYEIARAALVHGRPAVAREAALALLARNPRDLRAELLLSQAERDLGNFAAARAAAKRVWAGAGDGAQRYAAALARAQAEASDGRRTIAQYWLRRAVQEAPNDAARRRAIQDFRYVRARNPLSFRLDFGVAPSSNVNGGSSSDTLWLYGIPFTLPGSAQALSGLEYRLSANLEYTVSESPAQRTVLGVNIGGRSYQLSSSSERKAPGVKGSDFAFFATEAYLTQRRRAAGGGEWDGRLTAGHNVYSGAPLSDYLRVEGGRSWAIAPGRQLRLGTSFERQWRRDDDRNSATLSGLDTQLTQRFRFGELMVGAEIEQVQSPSSQVDHDRAALSLGYQLAKPVAGVSLGLSAGLDWRDYAHSPYATDGRRDTELSLGVQGVLSQAGYMGFAPELGLRYVHTNSNVSLYESDEIGVTLRLRSAF
ncbi:hypothetical protein SDC9_28811 [bioreactor metagenome]|uniref:Surface lipoprotein assembly modifier C-terminal domain-containing protein n=1 Tax=bioreactor metagenome TaxID=1076179 RepID=A0A644UVN5_9ZZZZ